MTLDEEIALCEEVLERLERLADDSGSRGFHMNASNLVREARDRTIVARYLEERK